MERLYPADERLSQPERNLNFAMQCNGYFMLENGEYSFDPNTTKPSAKEFQAQRVSFFGPNTSPEANNFFSAKDVGHSRFIDAFSQPPFTSVISKYRQVDEDLAARMAFIFGGLVRHLAPRREIEIGKAVKFAAQMTALGERKSADAIASAMAMYIISGGSLKDDRQFAGQIFHMAEAIREDPIIPLETKDLGLSQVVRLHTFIDEIQAKRHRPFPDIVQYKGAFEGFPTVGAEFHFSPDAPLEHPNFWQRLSLLNMSQYQRGSYIQMSRNDRDVIEVRMNPSVYPITVANWRHLRLLLPELNRAFFTITLNRPREDFAWNKNDTDLLNKLRALGMLSYPVLLENVPRIENKEEIDFGAIYLGQTVRMVNGEYKFTGGWWSGEGNNGQLAIYAGFGDNLPYLAYYLSMALSNPAILRSMPSIFWSQIMALKDALAVRTLKDALAVTSTTRIGVFKEIQNRIEADRRLKGASVAGNQIMELLNP